MGDNHRKLKEGEVLRFKSGLLGKKWKECWAVLFSDSEFVWYDKKVYIYYKLTFLSLLIHQTSVSFYGDSKPAGSVFLKDVVPYTCVGPMCDRMPVRRPDIPERHSLYHLVGIGMDAQGSKVHWFLFASDSDLESWFTEIMKTLPRPSTPHSGTQQPAVGVGAPPPSYNPPPVYPSGPPPVANTYPSQPAYNPQANLIQPPPSQYGGGAVPIYGATGTGYGTGTGGGGTTVIIDRGGGDYGRHYGGGYGGSSGPGLGTGMLMGSLLGFGLGSVWGGGLHSGYGLGGFGSPAYSLGSGFGGGYVQDNDTYITNNYYGGGPEGGNVVAGGDSGPAITDVTDATGGQNMVDDSRGDYDVGGGGDYGGYDIGGGDDFGGGIDDFGGGGDDFGGVDFGGGDW